MRNPLRIEWVSVLYLALFVLAVLTPRLVAHNYFGIEQAQIEESLIFCFGVVGLVTFSLYERLMERREKEREEAVRDRDKTRQELVSSYEYIGAMNRQVEALKSLANDTAAKLMDNEGGQNIGAKHAAPLFQSLAASAATFVRAQQATIRIVELDQLRTVREFHTDSKSPVHIQNKELYRVHQEGLSHAFVHGEKGQDVLVIPSDRQSSPFKAFILALADPSASKDLDDGILKVYANQAELLHHSLGRKQATKGEPLELVRAAERQMVGEVS